MRVRTIAYVDGFNLSFGSLRKTPHRWLDLQCLIGLHLKPQNQLIGIKYFTAKLNQRPNDPDAPARQEDVSPCARHAAEPRNRARPFPHEKCADVACESRPGPAAHGRGGEDRRKGSDV